MEDLTTLLDRAAGPTPAVDALGDLTRGRRALARARRRRAGTGLLGLALAGAAGLGGVTLADGPTPSPRVVDVPETPPVSPAGGVRLLAQPFEAGPYTFDSTPEGWYVQGAYPQGVTIAPVDGDVDPDPTVFTGKLVIMFSENPPSGELVSYDGRDFWVRGDSGYTTILTRTRPGEPEGTVSVQFPGDTGWTQETMLEFLASVQVGPDALPGLG
jgi:hypothetical protein